MDRREASEEPRDANDGRDETLLELLRASDANMGHTDGLGEGDLRALAAYMESL